MMIGEDNVTVGRRWGVAGRETDDDGGGMRKGTAPEEDDDGVDDIRTMGNDGV